MVPLVPRYLRSVALPTLFSFLTTCLLTSQGFCRAMHCNSPFPFSFLASCYLPPLLPSLWLMFFVDSEDMIHQSFLSSLPLLQCNSTRDFRPQLRALRRQLLSPSPSARRITSPLSPPFEVPSFHDNPFPIKFTQHFGSLRCVRPSLLFVPRGRIFLGVKSVSLSFCSGQLVL